MAELVEPFERELRRRLLEDAESEYRRRTTQPKQYLPLSEEDIASGIISREAPQRGAMTISEMIENPVAEPENPAAVRQELFGGLMNPRSSGISPTPRTYKFGNSLVSVDPRAGTTKEIFTAPEKPDTRSDAFEKQVILGEIAALRRLQGDRLNLAVSGKTPEQIEAEIQALNEKGRNLFRPQAAAPAPAAAPTPTPQIFMGDPAGQDPFTAPAPKDALTDAPVTTKQQFDALPSGAIYIGRNGKRFRKP